MYYNSLHTHHHLRDLGFLTEKEDTPSLKVRHLV